MRRVPLWVHIPAVLGVCFILIGPIAIIPMTGLRAMRTGDAARAILGQAEVHPDVDRIIAVYPDGRAFGWHQLNDKTPERGVMD